MIERLKQQLFRLGLYWRSRAGEVRDALDELDLARTRRPNISRSPDTVRVAAVQLELRPFESPRDYARHIGLACREAAAQGAHFIVFPEDSATHLLGLLPGFTDAEAGGEEGLAQAYGLDEVPYAEVFRLLGPAMRRVYTSTFSYLAARLNVFIAAGSAVLPDRDEKVRNTAHLFGPRGRLTGKQAKCHLFPWEAEKWGLTRGDEFRVFGTPFGRVAMPVCMDVTYFETSRIITAMGAEIAAVPMANPEEYNLWKDLRGTWARVQESPIYCVQACLVGDMAGIHLEGRSAVYAPISLTRDSTGVLAVAQSAGSPAVITADLDLAGLRRLRATERGSEPLPNPVLFARELSPLYETAATGRRVAGRVPTRRARRDNG